MKSKPPELHDLIGTMLDERGPMSASAITKALSERGDLPPYWSVIDVADYMEVWFGNRSAP